MKYYYYNCFENYKILFAKFYDLLIHVIFEGENFPLYFSQIKMAERSIPDLSVTRVVEGRIEERRRYIDRDPHVVVSEIVEKWMVCEKMQLDVSLQRVKNYILLGQQVGPTGFPMKRNLNYISFNVFQRFKLPLSLTNKFDPSEQPSFSLCCLIYMECTVQEIKILLQKLKLRLNGAKHVLVKRLVDEILDPAVTVRQNIASPSSKSLQHLHPTKTSPKNVQSTESGKNEDKTRLPQNEKKDNSLVKSSKNDHENIKKSNKDKIITDNLHQHLCQALENYYCSPRLQISPTVPGPSSLGSPGWLQDSSEPFSLIEFGTNKETIKFHPSSNVQQNERGESSLDFVCSSPISGSSSSGLPISGLRSSVLPNLCDPKITEISPIKQEDRSSSGHGSQQDDGNKENFPPPYAQTCPNTSGIKRSNSPTLTPVKKIRRF